MNIHDALGAVAELRERVLVRQRFCGYSGVARAAGGTLALCAAALARATGADAVDVILLAVWGVVFAGALVLNYGAVCWWFLTEKRRAEALTPALEPLPVLLVGGILTAAIYHTIGPVLLPGVWMCVFALTQFSAKYALPRAIRRVGWFYIVAGAVCFACGEWAWREPLVMGAVFFFGEWAGGLILHAETISSRRNEPSRNPPFLNDDEN
ncbi:MAG: hypothetical protein LBV28_03365 [Puniceicoccales bacterium]|nr:hypothetical protein [Puniceicoccales bacterium]